MHRLKSLIILLVIPLLGFNAAHKYYVSNTQIEYVSEEKELQIISRVFINDFEMLLRQRYDETITLAETNEAKIIDHFFPWTLEISCWMLDIRPCPTNLAP